MGNESNRFHQELIRPYTEKLLKVKDINTGNIKFNPIFYTEVKELQPFIENNETTKIKLGLKRRNRSYRLSRYKYF